MALMSFDGVKEERKYPQRTSTLKEHLLYIKEHLTYRTVFAYYGLAWKTDKEHQFSCSLHGDGKDRNPSARYYPDTKCTVCYACTKDVWGNGGDVTWYIRKREKIQNHWDVVDFIKEKFGVSMDSMDLPKRIEMKAVTDQEAAGDLRETFKKGYQNKVNNTFFTLRQEFPKQQAQISSIERQVWRTLDEHLVSDLPYSEYCTKVRVWDDWVQRWIADIKTTWTA